MIGTLVVQLPCCGGHTGGSLTVRHKDMAYTHNFSQVTGLGVLAGVVLVGVVAVVSQTHAIPDCRVHQPDQGASVLTAETAQPAG